MIGWMYILECSDGSYYTGSTNNLELRIQQHQNGEGANHTKKRLPIKLLYSEEFSRIDDAFYREKQVQGWSRNKKEALINGNYDLISKLSKNYTQFLDIVTSAASTGSATESIVPVPEPVEGTVITNIVTMVASTSSATENTTGSTTEKMTGSTTDRYESTIPVPELVEGKGITNSKNKK